MSKLDYVELEMAAADAVDELAECASLANEREVVLAALTSIAKRAFAQASRLDAGEVVIDEPPVRLRDACAALDAPPPDLEDWCKTPTEPAKETP